MFAVGPLPPQTYAVGIIPLRSKPPLCPDPPVLSFAAATTRPLRDQLLAMFPNIDDETLADTLDGLSDLKDVLAEIIRSALIDEVTIDSLRAAWETCEHDFNDLKPAPDVSSLLHWS